MILEKSPDAGEAIKLMHQIASRPAKIAARKIDKPLAIYGAGKLGKMAIELLDRIGIHPAMVVNANPEASRNDPFWRLREILHPHEVPHDRRASVLLAVSIATLPYEQLAATLAAQGWQDIVPFYDVAEAYTNIHPLSNGWIFDHFNGEDIAATTEVLNTWSDDISRAHHIQFMAWHRFREDWIFDEAPIKTDDRYFIPEVVNVLNDHETFVDIGAHQGEISDRFREAVGNRYKRIWMIEPDSISAAKIEQSLHTLSEYDQKRNHLLVQPMAEQSGKKLFFPGLGYASQLSALGTELADTKTIDSLGLAPSFVKLHLEGHELAALKGATTTLRNYRPVLAATSYHNHLGLWQLPRWLMKYCERYHYYLRLHSWCGTGAVIYCIPDERTSRMAK